MSDTRHVFVVDDNATILKEIRLLLRAEGFEVSAFESPTEMLESTFPDTPFVVLLDMRMPHMSGLELRKCLRERGLSAPVVFISGESQPSEIVSAMRDPLADFLLKPFSKSELLTALEQAFARDAQQRSAMRNSQERQRIEAMIASSTESLSPREAQIFELVAKGFSNREIGVALDMKTDTVKKHRASVYRKFGVANLAEMLTFIAPRRTDERG